MRILFFLLGAAAGCGQSGPLSATQWQQLHSSRNVLPFLSVVTSDLAGAFQDCPHGTARVIALSLRSLAAAEGSAAALDLAKLLHHLLQTLPHDSQALHGTDMLKDVIAFLYEQTLHVAQAPAKAVPGAAVPLDVLEAYQRSLFTATVEEYTKVLPASTDRAILPSEGLAFVAFGRLHNVSVVVESGVWKGFSTELWARTFEKVVAADLQIRQEARETLTYPNVRLVEGDGHVVIPRALQELAEERVAVFIDGPKGEAALRMAERLLADYPQVRFVALHDMKPWKDTLRSGTLRLQTFFISDEPWFVDQFGWMDAASLGDGGPMAFVERPIQ